MHMLNKIRRKLALYRKEQAFRSWSRSPAGVRNREGLARLRNLHSGRRCFIIGNGPSLKQMDLGSLSREITIGCNGLFLLFDAMKFAPTYYTVEDPLVAADRARELRSVNGPLKVFPYDLSSTLDPMPDALWVNFRRDLDATIPEFSDDITEQAFWGGTVTYFNLQLAAHLGCSPIYLIGVDHSYSVTMPVEKQGSVWTSQADDVNHFDPNYFGKGYRWHDPNVARMELAYMAASRYAEATGSKIINATVGGKLEVFPRADFTSLLRKHV